MIKNPKVGDRVAWRCPYSDSADKGTITGFGNYDQIRVRWDSDGGELATYPQNCRRLVKKKRAPKGQALMKDTLISIAIVVGWILLVGTVIVVGSALLMGVLMYWGRP